MKKKCLFIVMFTVPLFLIFGCASASGNKEYAQTNVSSNNYLPEWVTMTPEAEDAIYAIGQATKSTAAISQKAADMRAIQGISEQVAVVVKTYVKDYIAQAGIGETAEVTELTSSVAKMISESTLKGAKIKKREVTGDTWYSLAEYKTKQASKEIQDALLKEAQKNEALYNEFKAKINFDEMEKEIEKAFHNE